MRDLAGRVAVVTGGGSGIGRGMALAFADAGMKLVLADIEGDAAEGVAAELAAKGAEATAVRTDVSDRAQVEALAERAFAAFDAVHLLCNNAGVTTLAPLHRTPDADWSWVLGVNLMGVVHGLQAFLPRMKAQPGPKHVVNTASIAGLVPTPKIGPYVASKYAVVGLSETLRLEGAHYDLSCSVLCPGNVRTGIVASARNRPDALGGPGGIVHEDVRAAIDEGMDPVAVGRLVRDAVERDELFIVTHPEQRELVEKRAATLLDAFDRAAQR